MIRRLQGELNPTSFTEIGLGMKKIKAPEVDAINIQLNCSKRRYVLSNDHQKFNSTRIDLKFLPHILYMIQFVFEKFH
jgi:hypothetical protein